MCLRTKDKSEKTAEKHIPVYKFGTTSILLGFIPEFRTFSYGRYVKQKYVKLRPGVLYQGGAYIVDEGYHSFNKLQDCKDASHRYSDLGLFIIPKGAQYIDGVWDNFTWCDNRVSTTLIYLGKNNKFNRWIAKIFYGVNFEK